MATKPINTKLWDMIVAQAKAKYSNYPNPGASHWVHSQYEKHGGKFVEITADDRKRMRLSMQFQKKRHEQARKNREKNAKNKDD
jgi:Spy/CpxP family protein refolding chaperone